jgi:hypothetical protein
MGAAERKFLFCPAIIERQYGGFNRETDPRTTLTGKMDTRSPLDGN